MLSLSLSALMTSLFYLLHNCNGMLFHHRERRLRTGICVPLSESCDWIGMSSFLEIPCGGGDVEQKTKPPSAYFWGEKYLYNMQYKFLSRATRPCRSVCMYVCMYVCLSVCMSVILRLFFFAFMSCLKVKKFRYENFMDVHARAQIITAPAQLITTPAQPPASWWSLFKLSSFLEQRLRGWIKFNQIMLTNLYLKIMQV